MSRMRKSHYYNISQNTMCPVLLSQFVWELFYLIEVKRDISFLVENFDRHVIKISIVLSRFIYILSVLINLSLYYLPCWQSGLHFLLLI